MGNSNLGIASPQAQAIRPIIPYSSTMLESLVETCRDGILAFDKNCHYLLWNPAMERISGMKRQDVIGRCAFDVFPFLRQTGEDSFFFEALAGKTRISRDRSYKIPATGKNGFFEGYYSPLFGPDGTVFGGYAFIRDITERKREQEEMSRLLEEKITQREAGAAERKIKGLLEGIADGFAAFDDKWRYVYLNETIAKMAGQSPVEMLGKCVWDLFPEVIGTPFHHGMLRAMQERVHVRTEAYYEPFKAWFENHIYPIEGGISIYVSDITDRKKIEEELRRKEEDLTDFFENAAIGIHWVGPDGIIIKANRHELDLLGYAPEEYIGRHIAEFHANQKTIQDILRRLMNHETLVDYEADLRCKDGSIKNVLINSNVLWRDGQFIHTRCFTRDVTDRKKAEENLRQSQKKLTRERAIARANEEYYRVLSETLPQIIWTSDPEGNLTYCNQRWYEYTGLTEAETKPHGWVQAVHPEEQQRSLEVWRQAVESGSVYEIEYRLRNASGDYRWHLVRGLPMKDEEGRITSWLGTSTDIDDYKRIREKFAEANEELTRLNRIRSEFTSMITHELRTPLSAIKEAISITLEGIDGPVTRDQTNTLEIARHNVDRLARMVHNVLDFSRLESGQFKLMWQKADVNDLVSETCRLMKMAARKKEIEFAVDLPSKPVEAVCDSDKIRQVLINLVDNAIKFTDRKGLIQVRLAVYEGQVRIEVEDNGKGVRKEDFGKIFEMFGQSLYKPGGFGVGLAVCRKIMEQHQGDLGVESELGRGSCFKIIFPLNPTKIDKSI